MYLYSQFSVSSYISYQVKGYEEVHAHLLFDRSTDCLNLNLKMPGNPRHESVPESASSLEELLETARNLNISCTTAQKLEYYN